MIHVFVINPETGKDNFGEQLRKQLESIPNMTYYVFNTRNEGDEKQLVKRIVNLFEDEDIRIYCCGGSGTIRNIIDGLDNLDRVEIAFYPNGMTNDFLKCFGQDQEKFSNLNELIQGEAVPIDYISTNCGDALNAISLGIDADVINTINDMRQWHLVSDAVPYLLGFLHGFLHAKKRKYIVEVDGIMLNTSATELVFANGCVISGKLQFFNNPEITDGYGEYGIVVSKNLISNFKAIKCLTSHKVEKIYHMILHGKFKTVKIRREDSKPYEASFDGELVQIPDELVITNKTKALRFVVPKGVKLP